MIVLWAVGYGLKNSTTTLHLPLPWWPFDRLKVLSNAEGERKPAVVEKL